MVMEVDRKILPKFETKDVRDKHVAGLKFWEQELHEAAKEDYLKFSRTIRKDLVTLFGVLKSLCHVSLRRRLESELEHKAMIQDDACDVTVLHHLIRKACSGSTSVVVDDVVGSTLEALFNFLLNRGEDHESLPKHMEASDHRFEVLKTRGFTFDIPESRDNYLVELRSRT